ncbi:uncharacterized protein NEMAJ01_1992 [Nematocida major]|uniref:uncharacterized protein n=1 Tax=Nematocida major TaxID=1912982 RepID=UPI002007A798|nr:uncharacterized protein NEMAJ01_1992 [Nematocida major]KAH9387096.1 hypothetical protein NEMAJ01_1992 [Nematocida major]
MQISYKAAEGFFLLVPILLSYAFKGKLNEILTQHVLYVRIAFVVSMCIDLLISYRIKCRVELHNVKTKIKFAFDDYVVVSKPARENKDPKQPAEDEEEETEIEMTVHDYDLKVINSHMSRMLYNAAIHLAIHLYSKSTQPMIMLIMNPVKNFIFFPPYIEYITGWSMLRPFSRNFIIGGAEKRRTTKPAESLEEIPEKDMKVKKEE